MRTRATHAVPDAAGNIPAAVLALAQLPQGSALQEGVLVGHSLTARSWP